MVFRGTFDYSLDAKNRLTVPARFRAALAEGVRSAFDAVAKTRAAHPELGHQFVAQSLPAESAITPGPLEIIFGVKAQQNSGMVNVGASVLARAAAPRTTPPYIRPNRS